MSVRGVLFQAVLAVLLSAVFVVYQPGNGAAVENLVSRQFGRFRISFTPADARFADRVMAVVRETEPSLSADIGIETADSVRIHIAPTREAFESYTPHAIPDWGEGYAVPDLNLIVLKSPRIDGSIENLRQVVVHETAHVLLHSAMRNADIPRWLDEGFAIYSARDWGVWERANLVVAVLGGNLIPLEAIGAVNTFPEPKAQLAYQESALAVQYIVSQYGRSGLREILRHLRSTGSINSALMQSQGMSVVEFERDWYRYISRNYGWRAVPAEALSLLIGPLFVCLLVIAYLTMIRRRRRIMRQWADEDEWSLESDGWRERDDDRWGQMNRRWERFEQEQEE